MPDMGVAERSGLTLGTVEAPSGAYAEPASVRQQP